MEKHRTKFAYDAAGRLTNEVQTVGQASSLSVGYEYYADGRRKKLIYPDATYITYEYNTKGWLTAIKDGGTNSIVTYDYDDAGRRTQRTLENNTFTIYDYDNADQLTSIWHKRVSGVTNTVSRYEYGYDDAGNRKWVKRAHQSNKGDVYTYDAADQLTGVKYNASSPDSSPSAWDREVTYGYDAAGNRTNLIEKIGNATNITSYAANSDNQLTSATATRQGLTVTGAVDPGASSNKWYASTAAARSVSAGVSSTNGTFAIPGVPVTGGANALTVTVTDVSGNIATQVVNVTIATAATTLGYDANGNQTNDAVWGYTYDGGKRLVSATAGALTVTYTYDALGRLIQRRTSGSSITTNRLYYAGWQPVAEYDGAGILKRKYVFGPDLDETIRMAAGSTNYYYHVDALGSVSEITDSVGVKIESYAYDVYGATTVYNATGVLTNASQISNRLLFTGRDRDSDTGWYNHRNRYYNPTPGRFVQADPLRINGGGINLYRYCANDPVNFRDPLGLRPKGSDDPWFDRLGTWSRNRINEAADWNGNNLWWPLAGTLNTLMEIGQGTLGLPQALGHLGEGTGRWWGDPTLENFSGVCSDVSLAAGTLAAGLGAVQEGAADTGAASAADAARLRTQLTAEEIAGGHAFDKHVIQNGEFPGITTRAQFSGQIENVINNASDVKILSNGRTAYWDSSSGTVVIRNPSAADGGTAFKPTQGKATFDRLR